MEYVPNNPTTEKQLKIRLAGFASPFIIDNTIKRINSFSNWEDFNKDHPLGTIIDPYIIQDIVEQYYKNKVPPPAPTPPRGRTRAEVEGLTFVERVRRPNGATRYSGDTSAYDNFYIYRDKAGAEVESKVDLHTPSEYNSYPLEHTSHGGKRKSRRVRKSKKSRKNCRKSKRRR